MKILPGDTIQISDMGMREAKAVILNPRLNHMGCIRARRGNGEVCSVHFSRIERLNGFNVSSSDILKAASEARKPKTTDKSINPNKAFRKYKSDELREKRIQKGRRANRMVKKRMA